MNILKKPYQFLLLILSLILFTFSLVGCEDFSPAEESSTTEYLKEVDSESKITSDDKTDDTQADSGEETTKANIHLDPEGSYTTKEDVMNYLIEYGTLPSNFITKKEAKALGWPGKSLEPYAPGKCIGGDYFGNYEKKLPVKKGVEYHECDIDTLGAKSRGPKRIIYSNDGHIYYTDDHYDTFTLIYDGEKNQ